MKDFWFDEDDMMGCLECGSTSEHSSRVPGVCVSCLTDASYKGVNEPDLVGTMLEGGWVEE